MLTWVWGAYWHANRWSKSVRGFNFGAVTIWLCQMAIFRVADARQCNSRGGTSICGLKMAFRVLSTRSRVYLSGGSGEFSSFWSESWVLSVIMVLSFGTSTVVGFLVLVEVICCLSLKCWSFQTNVMSIDRRAVFREHVYVVWTQRTASPHYWPMSCP